MIADIAIGRAGNPEDTAPAVAFFLSLNSNLLFPDRCSMLLERRRPKQTIFLFSVHKRYSRR